MKPSLMLRQSFWCGFFVHAFITMFGQDWLGQEKYIRIVQEDWVNTHWSMWLILALLAAFWYYSIQRKLP